MVDKISSMRWNRSEAPRTYGLDRGLEYDQLTAARCIEVAHRFSFFACEVAMLIACGDLGVRQQCGIVFVLQLTSVKRVTLLHHWFQRTESYVLLLLLEAVYSNKHQ